MSYRHHSVANHAPAPRTRARSASRVAVQVRSNHTSTRAKLIQTAIVLLTIAAFFALLLHLAVPAGEPLHLSSYVG